MNRRDRSHHHHLGWCFLKEYANNVVNVANVANAAWLDVACGNWMKRGLDEKLAYYSRLKRLRCLVIMKAVLQISLPPNLYHHRHTTCHPPS